jgi:hypothetical protein
MRNTHFYLLVTTTRRTKGIDALPATSFFRAMVAVIPLLSLLFFVFV